ncbi:MAG: fused response regulator/phosphatase [Planctomycetes bacterium]|nr:fused response regulator/phosphatase [Planctomycetota bacterium]
MSSAAINVNKPQGILRILVIEDNQADAFLICAMLEDAKSIPFETTVAGTLAEGLEMLAAKRFHAVILDLALPDSRGLDTFRRVRQGYPSMPVLLLTGMDDETLAMQAVTEGAQEFLVKGQVSERRLVQALNHAVGRQARLSRVERALRNTREEQLVVSQVARHLLPRDRPVIAGWDVAGASIPVGYSGGDLLDWFPTSPGKWRVAIGDATGHGVGPSLIMATTRAYLRAFSGEGVPLDETLRQTNRELCRDLAERWNVTLFLAEIDTSDGSLSYASAGHLPAILLDGHGAEKGRFFSTGLPLGIFSDSDYNAEKIGVSKPGDLLLQVTDGVVDSRQGASFFGLEGAAKAARKAITESADVVVERVFSAVSDFNAAAGNASEDDTTVLVVRRTAEQLVA